MQITKKNLKQLIAEEYAKIMNEEPGDEAIEEDASETAKRAHHGVEALERAAITHDAQISAMARFLEEKYPDFKLPLRHEEKN